MRPALAIGVVELRRFFRDRSNIFFVFIFPLLLVLVIGLQFGENSSQGRVAVAGDGSALRTAVVDELEADDVTVTFDDADDVREQLARGRSDVGLFVSDRAARAFDEGENVRIEIVTAAQSGSQATVQDVRAAVRAVGVEQSQVTALTTAGLDEEAAQDALARARETIQPPEVSVSNVDELAQEFSGVGQFDVGAAQQTLLFVFLISLAGSATLIQARREGVVARTLAAPVSAAQVIAGQVLGRFVIAMLQGGYIMAASSLLFGVAWGNIALALLILSMFCVVAAAAAMVIGSVMDNDSAASGVGVGTGLVLAGLGGSMLPLELFPDGMRTIADFTPHAWGYEAFAEIQRHGAGLVDILPSIGVLAAMAAVLLALGSWLLRRSLARAL
ncbi:ABC-2 type transport system permease protein [Haloactinopolyspora alba]|uniref:ABC-2 type transport system permease protein n=1 Tax=Haloactinopolyspora alba TaxID=648780 RepID=A0A2P8EFV4_9ACTN|nr:ABC transporter permease [Haloactinopolyspora alba]PSL08346.1 ABC-2 type transport system permease protein [Haloactinopolyspora alba]